MALNVLIDKLIGLYRESCDGVSQSKRDAAVELSTF